MKKVFGFILVVAALSACGSNGKSSSKSEKKKVEIHYLNHDSTAYTRCISYDTITLDGRKFIKVWGVSGCKYSCPVLMEVK